MFEDDSLKKYRQYTKDFKIGCHYLDVPTDICKKRVERRNKINGELYLPIEVIDSYSKRLVSPSIDEGYVFIKIYNENLDLIKELK